MRFLFVTSGPRAPTTRFRVLPYLSFLEKAGHRCDVAHSWPEKYEYFRTIGWRLSQRLKRSVRHWHAYLASRRRYDAIFLEREVFDDDTWDLEQRFRNATDRLVLDVDDAIFLRHPDKFPHVVGLCDHVIAGNKLLMDYIAGLPLPTGQRPSIEIIPTTVRLSDYTVKSVSLPRAALPVVGWIGTSYNVAYLGEASWGLREAAKQIPFKLLIVSGNSDHLQGLDLSGVNVEFRAWKSTNEISDLHEMDLGLMPLPPSDPWSKYKCGLKLIQYLAVGVPGIASPVGVNSEILASQAAGRLAATPEQWRDALIELLSDAGSRAACGRAARQIVEQQYATENHWRRLEQALATR